MTDPIHPASGDLLPCPFCGSTDVKLHDDRVEFFVRCDPCKVVRCGDSVRHLDHLDHGDVSDEEADNLAKAEFSKVDWTALRQSAIDAWNTRPANPPATAAGTVDLALAIERVEGLADAMEAHRHGSPGNFEIADWALWDQEAHLRTLIEALRTTLASHDALIAKVREALEPFAAVWQASGGAYPKTHPAWGFNHAGITWGDFHAARALLTDLDAKNGG